MMRASLVAAQTAPAPPTVAADNSSQPYPTPPAAPYGQQPIAQPYPQQPYAPQYPQQPYPQQPYPSWPDASAPYAGVPAQNPGDATAVQPTRKRRRRRRATPPPEEPSDQHAISLTVSLLHPLVVSVFDAALELRLARSLGFALIGGFGSIGLRQLDSRLPDENAHLFELGAQLRAYPIGAFDHGLQIGFEVMYLHGSADAIGTIEMPDGSGAKYTGSFTALGRGYKLGPFMGYKVTFAVGLTLNAQLGIEYFSVHADASDSLGHSEAGANSGPFPLADISAGWSF